MKPEPKEVSPRKVLGEVAAAVPPDVHPNIIIIGSLAAGYWLFQGDNTFGVRTKDIDCVLSPHLSAVEKGRAVAEKLLAAKWQPHFTGKIAKPGKATDTEDKLPPSASIRPAAANGSSNCSLNPLRKTRPLAPGRRYPSRPATPTLCPVFNSPASPPLTPKPPNLASAVRGRR